MSAQLMNFPSVPVSLIRKMDEIAKNMETLSYTEVTVPLRWTTHLPV